MLEEPGFERNRRVPPALSQPLASTPPIAALVLASLARNKLLIVTCGLLGLLGAYAFTKLARPRFEAHAELLVDPRDLVVLDKEVTPRSSASDSGIAVVESQAHVLESDIVLRRVIAMMKLDEDPEFNGKRRGLVATAAEQLAGLIGYDAAPEARDPKLSALQTLEQRIWVKRTERTFIVDLSVWSTSAEKSVALADAIIKSYLEEQASARSDPAKTAGEAIDSGLEALRLKVAETEDKAAKYRVAKNLVGASGRLVNEQQLTEINNQLLAARADLGRAKAKHDEAQRLRNKPDSIPEALNSPAMRQLRGQLSAIVSQKAKLSAQLKPQHPVMISVVQQEHELRSEIGEELARVITSAGIEYDRAKAVEAGLTRDLESLRSQMNTTNESQIKLRELEGELEANRAVYQAAVVRARETRQQARLNTTNVRVIAEPTPARDRAFPPSNLIVLPMGLLLGLGTGAFLGLLRDGLGWRHAASGGNGPPAQAVPLSPGKSTPAPVSALVTSPGSTSTPVSPPATPPARAPAPGLTTRRSRIVTDDDPPYTYTNLRGILGARAGANQGIATPDDEALRVFDFAAAAVASPDTGIGRKFSRLSTHLETILALKGTLSRPHVVIITSDVPNPMKSVVALGLAHALHAKTRRVLLVDADVDDHRLSTIMTTPGRNGTLDVLSGTAPLGSCVRKRQGSFDCLTVTRPSREPGANTINKESLGRIVSQAGHYDAIVIEAPALGSHSVEATFSEAAGQVLLAMRVPPASEDIILGAMHTLRKAVPKFCGLVITD